MSKLTRPTHQSPGVYHFGLGEFIVTSLNDGILDGSRRDFFDVVTNIGKSEAQALHHAVFRAVPPRMAVNAFLLHLADRLVLFDGGCGMVFAPAAGRLITNLITIGVKPADIDTILVTRLHPDHAGGLVASSGAVVFPRVELVMHESERAYWSDSKVPEQASTDQERQWIQLSVATIAAYRGRMRTVTSGEVFPSVTAVPEPGHTPGHTGWLLASGGDSLLISLTPL